MNATPKWYYKNKSNYLQIFKNLTHIFRKARYLTKITADILNFNALGDHMKVIDDYENIFQAYIDLRREQHNIFTTIKRMRRGPYKSILISKITIISSLHDMRFQQLIYVFREMLFLLFKKTSDFNVLRSSGFELAETYNRCNENINNIQANGLNSNICSNSYPTLLLRQKNLDFGVTFQLMTYRKIETKVLNILLRLFNMNESFNLNNDYDSTASSLEVLRILTHNIEGETDFTRFSDTNAESWGSITDAEYFRKNNAADFLHKENLYLFNLILECRTIAPSICYEDNEGPPKKLQYETLFKAGLKTMWTHISSILDHVILWWIETPMSCYSLTYVDCIRNLTFSDGFGEAHVPIQSSLKAFCEILTVFVSNNLWDKLFRNTLVTSTHSRKICISIKLPCENLKMYEKNATKVGRVWIALFNHLQIFNNIFSLTKEEPTGQLAVAEQIPVLHRIDHSIHSMRIWVQEHAKYQCSQWVIDAVFQVLNYDIKECLRTLTLINLDKITLESADILLTVCISLREKLVMEVIANILKLKNAFEECICVLSSVCRTLSLASFSLCFPSQQHWQKNYVKKSKSGYVLFVLENIFLPALNGTNDINILELILKLICEAWIDFIYSKRIKFSSCGALTLLNDFDQVKEWISSIPYLPSDYFDILSNHDVLHMCKGVGKVLVRKPREMISILHSPQCAKSYERSARETRLPAEMFVSNQSHWLQLRVASEKFSFLICCTKN